MAAAAANTSQASEFATCSEDRTVKVFRDGQLLQTINHPGAAPGGGGSSGGGGGGGGGGGSW